MKTKLIIMLISSVILISCRTINGTLNGAGSILEGIASDARQLGNIFPIITTLYHHNTYIL